MARPIATRWRWPPDVDLGRSHVDADHVGNLPAPIRAAAARHARAAALAKTGDELAAQLASRLSVDGRVDRLVRDVVFGLVGVHALERSGNLLRRPLPAQQGQHDAPGDAAHFELGRRLDGRASRALQPHAGPSRFKAFKVDNELATRSRHALHHVVEARAVSAQSQHDARVVQGDGQKNGDGWCKPGEPPPESGWSGIGLRSSRAFLQKDGSHLANQKIGTEFY
jgi:hypothetical protein